jgi:hypothetical protein
VKDAQGDPAYGRTNWRRFAVAAGVPAVVGIGLVVALAQGALAASFSVSGTQFKLSADKLEGTGFTQYSGTQTSIVNQDQTKGKYVVEAMSGIKSADIYNLCQSVSASGVVLRIEAGKGTKKEDAAHADDLLIGMSELSGDATFDHITIGQDASTLDASGAAAHGDAGGFGQQANGVTILNLRQKAWSTTASTFKLTGMSLHIYLGDSSKECYAG